MEKKLYVGNLSFNTTEDELKQLFSQAGTVAVVTLIKDRDSGQSKGFAFVEMGNATDAENAIRTLNGKTLGDRELKVSLARPKEERSSGGYERGGFGDNRNNHRKPGGNRRY